MNLKFFFGVLAGGLVFLLSGQALAHNVTVFAWVEGNTVFGESKFSGGRRPKGAEVIVWDARGGELLRTRTDDNGEFSFELPEKIPMRIELIAGMGHKGEWKITMADLGEDDAADPPDTPPAAKAAASAKDDPKKTVAPAGPCLDDAQLASLVEKAVANAVGQKLKPVMKFMADLEEKGPSVNDVMGGIGYIFGLMGVAAYFMSRRKKG